MRFPPDFILRLRSHFLVYELVGKYIPIKKHGREYLGLCPFHKEKTPSFHAYDDHYHCFGCGAHGDAIEFLRRYEKLSYPETIEKLARDAGIPLPEQTPEDARRAEAAKTQYDVLEAACQWFEKSLDGVNGATARDYVEKRGLKAETLRMFRIGYAPEDRAALYQYLLKAGFSQSLQAEAGLIIVPENGTPYDRFRGRIIFPIRNASGKIIAFGGRLITANKNLPKYLNSPETPLFKKGEVLYNVDLARKSARDVGMAVVMEGYMDVVSVAQSGISYAMATLGTAVTAEHLRLLWQLVKEPVMCLDGDAAGKRAMQRAADIALPLLKPGFSLRFAILPKGEDPDSYVQKHGKKGFETLLASNALQLLHQELWKTLFAKHQSHINLPEGRTALENECLQAADLIVDDTVKKYYKKYFKDQIWKHVSTLPYRTPNRAPQVTQMAVTEGVAPFDEFIRQIMYILGKFPALLHQGQMDERLSRIEISDQRLNTVRRNLLEAVHEGSQDEAAIAEICLQLSGDAQPFLHHIKTPEKASKWLEKIFEAYHSQVELQRLQETPGDWNEERQARIDALKASIRKQNALIFVPLEADMA